MKMLNNIEGFQAEKKRDQKIEFKILRGYQK